MRKVEIEFRDDVDQAPSGKILLAWGIGGWRFMRRDAVGQWRSMIGRPKVAPKFWAEPPKIAMEAPE